jgi:hypothetical protein
MPGGVDPPPVFQARRDTMSRGRQELPPPLVPRPITSTSFLREQARTYPTGLCFDGDCLAHTRAPDHCIACRAAVLPDGAPFLAGDATPRSAWQSHEAACSPRRRVWPGETDTLSPAMEASLRGQSHPSPINYEPLDWSAPVKTGTQCRHNRLAPISPRARSGHLLPRTRLSLPSLASHGPSSHPAGRRTGTRFPLPRR